MAPLPPHASSSAPESSYYDAPSSASASAFGFQHPLGCTQEVQNTHELKTFSSDLPHPRGEKEEDVGETDESMGPSAPLLPSTNGLGLGFDPSGGGQGSDLGIPSTPTQRVVGELGNGHLGITYGHYPESPSLANTGWRNGNGNGGAVGSEERTGISGLISRLFSKRRRGGVPGIDLGDYSIVGRAHAHAHGHRPDSHAHAHSRSHSRTSFRPIYCLFILPILLISSYSVLQRVSESTDKIPNLPGTSGIKDMILGSGSAGSERVEVMDVADRCTCGGRVRGISDFQGEVEVGVEGEWRIGGGGVEKGLEDITSEHGDRLCRIYGEQGLRRSRLVTASGARLRKTLRKAKSGVPIKVGILGGSVSACHGVHPSPTFRYGDPAGPGCYTTILKGWLDTTFGTGSTIINGAIGGMDSSYYAFCGTHHITADVDLIVLEFDVNDQASGIYQHFFDQLLRVLLELPSQPAVVILGAWSPLVAQDQGYGDPQVVHLPIAHYYDVPYLSLKRLMFNHYLRFPESTKQSFFQQDGLHPNMRGHRIMADVLIAYFEQQLCILNTLGDSSDHQPQPVDETVLTTDEFSQLVDIGFPLLEWADFDVKKPPSNWQDTFDTSLVSRIGDEAKLFVGPRDSFAPPLIPMFQPLRDIVSHTDPDPKTPAHIQNLRQPKPFCADANDPEHPMQPVSSDGWEAYAWREEKHYWVTSQVGARIRVNIEVNEGRIAVYYFRSKHYDLGDAKCWVDDNEQGAVRLPGYWTNMYNVATVAFIDEKVAPGEHYVTCQVSLSPPLFLLIFLP